MKKLILQIFLRLIMCNGNETTLLLCTRAGPILRWPLDCTVKNKYLSQDSNRTRCWHTVTVALYSWEDSDLMRCPVQNADSNMHTMPMPHHLWRRVREYLGSLDTKILCYFFRNVEILQKYLFRTTKFCEGKWEIV